MASSARKETPYHDADEAIHPSVRSDGEVDQEETNLRERETTPRPPSATFPMKNFANADIKEMGFVVS